MSLYVNIPDAGSAGGSSVTSPLSGDGSGGNPIVIAAASAATAGTMSIADFNKLATVPTGMGVPWYAVSAEVDFSALANTAWGSNWPTVSGYVFVPANARLFVTALSGSHVASPACSVGTNSASFNNIIPNSPFAAAVLNAGIAASISKNWAVTMSASLNTVTSFPELTATPTVIVGVACTGGTVLKGKIVVVGSLMPVVP